MRRHLCHALALPLLLVSGPVGVAAQSPAPQAVSSAPGSPDVLRKLFEELLAASKAGDQQTLTARLSAFALPQHDSWFRRVFGEEKGAEVAAWYAKSVPELESRLLTTLKTIVAEQKFDVAVLQRTKEEQRPFGPHTTILAAMKEPAALYSVDFYDQDRRSSASVVWFAYVEGAFRYLGPIHRFFPPPKRLVVDGNILQAHMIEHHPPEYPPLAKQARIQGTVRLQVVIDFHGNVAEIQVLQGHPLLVQAAINAVRKWRYRPTLLNGEPVQVRSWVDVVFALNTKETKKKK
jgi:TonB family protein